MIEQLYMFRSALQGQCTQCLLLTYFSGYFPVWLPLLLRELSGAPASSLPTPTAIPNPGALWEVDFALGS